MFLHGLTLSTVVTVVTAAAAPKPAYAQWLTDSMIRFGVQPGIGYGEATLYTGFESVLDASKNKTLNDIYRSHIDAALTDDGVIKRFNYSHFSLDNYRIGNNILYWYEKTGEEKYKLAADSIKEMIDKHPRTPTGGLWHRHVVYPNQMWLDGIYMADSFYAKWVSLFQPKNQTAWDDIALQFDKIDSVTRKKNNLLVHGFDESKKAVWADPVTGAAPLIWARAIGWYYMSLLEVIPLFPDNHPAKKRLLGYFVNLSDGLKKSIDEKGAWWNIMDKQYEDVEGNYLESSASAMFVFGWLKGLNLGFLKEKSYGAVAKKAYSSLVKMFVTKNDDGTINWEDTVIVGSLGSNATFQYYASIGLRQNDLRGAGSFIVAAVEYEKRYH
ncbi:uncharacterized protein NECHADRAFT_52013 [Fusarium vanettenii 77-13-4]|uniref:Glycoside hydrolase family 105 n=1 Tax=Fusarium vanettenii (strain ATCC MYA-4622 / CBS 123669 / FGSC 9596 / NRRL 45880 / 77-13-4) TaxID=660122 RepID=C7ZFS2_FUSV7|nr:uncharacterized protein NECHADRAFT_52013 [Fusarium vanettenii 77-13-4]EEU36995.1 hypothetical protein NECHADRAFT_52013 [Fusarium vanettenii 77-13-4]